MSTPAQQIDLVTADEYLAMDLASSEARVEFAAGHIFALAGASRHHAIITANLTALLHRATDGGDCQVYASDMRLKISEDLFFYPDAMVACGNRGGSDRDETAPVLLVEVLSDATVHRDLGLKLTAYRLLRSLRAYLVVSQDERRIEVHWRENESPPWRHEVFRGAAAMPMPALGGLEVPMDAVYARTEV